MNKEEKLELMEERINLTKDLNLFINKKYISNKLKNNFKYNETNNLICDYTDILSSYIKKRIIEIDNLLNL
jgi:hypothetical protein